MPQTWRLTNTLPYRSLVLNVAMGGLLSFAYSSYDIPSAVDDLYLTSNYLSAAAGFFGYLASILLNITLVELAGGFLFCLKPPGEPSSSRRLGRFAILGWSFVLFALSVSRLGLSEAFYSRHTVLEDESEYEDYFNALATINRIGTALVVLFWLTNLPILGYAAFVVHKTRQHPLLRGVCSRFLLVSHY